MAVAANQSGIVLNPGQTVAVNQHSYVDWAAIVAGAVLATAISFVFLTFGSAIGLSLTSPYAGESMSLGWFALAVTLWVLWVEVSSFMAGAYLTGRLRRRMDDATEHEVDVRDRAHGLMVWAVGALLGAVLAVGSVGGAANTAAQAVGAATGAAISLSDAQAKNPDTTFGLLVDSLFRSDTPRAAAVENGSRGEVARILAHSAVQGTLSDADRTYAARVVAANTGLSEAQAQARVDEMYGEAKTTVADAKAAAEKARKIGILVAFVTAASLLVSAAGAVYAAGRGGHHRDKGLVLPLLVVRRK